MGIAGSFYLLKLDERALRISQLARKLYTRHDSKRFKILSQRYISDIARNSANEEASSRVVKLIGHYVTRIFLTECIFLAQKQRLLHSFFFPANSARLPESYSPAE